MESSDSASKDELIVAGEPPLNKSRQRRTRVKTGCVTCRIRRVKCDEKRPSCNKCTSTGRKCDGYPSLPLSRRDLPVAVNDRRSLLLSCHHVGGIAGFEDGTEMLYFDFYRSKTTPGTSQFFASDFWEKLVLQLSHSEPSIKHAVLAISALHQQWDMYESSGYMADSSAVIQYKKGVKAARTMLDRTKSGQNSRKEDIEKVLVACVLFVCYENLIGDYEKAALHLSHGLQILEEEGVELSERGIHSRIGGSIAEVLRQFDFQAMTFSQTQIPGRGPMHRFRAYPPMPLPPRFESLVEIRSNLFEQMNWVITVSEIVAFSRYGIQQDPNKTPKETFIEAGIERDRAEANFANFWDLVEEYVDRICLPSDPEYRSSSTYAYLRVYHRSVKRILTAGCTGFEMSWDRYLVEYPEDLDLLEHLQAATADQGTTLSLEIGICIPLFVITNKCRDPSVRRRSIAILDRSKRKEGIWESNGAARVCERLMLVEEKIAREIRAAATGQRLQDITITCAADVPEEARAQVAWTHVDVATHTVHLSIKMRSGTIEDPIIKTVCEKVQF